MSTPSLTEWEILSVKDSYNEGVFESLIVSARGITCGYGGSMFFPGHDHHSPQDILDMFEATDAEDLVGRYCWMKDNGRGHSFVGPSKRQQKMQDVDLTPYCDEVAV